MTEQPPADLEVPDAARAALSDAVEGGARGDTAPDVRRIAAPVVAAAFRRVIEDHRYDGETQNSDFTDGMWHVLGLLEYRADELERGA